MEMLSSHFGGESFEAAAGYEKKVVTVPQRQRVARIEGTEDTMIENGIRIFFTGRVWKIRGQEYKIYVDRNKKQYRRRV
jgi:hypothetical protein